MSDHPKPGFLPGRGFPGGAPIEHHLTIVAQPSWFVGPLFVQLDVTPEYLSVKGGGSADGETLKKNPYRIVSISAFGAPEDHRLAIVWVKRDGPDWGLKCGTSYQELLDYMLNPPWDGYYPTLVTTNGDVEGPFFFAIVYEEVPAESSSALMLVARNSLPSMIDWIRETGFSLKSKEPLENRYISCASLLSKGGAVTGIAAIAKKQVTGNLIYWTVSVKDPPADADEQTLHGDKPLFERAHLRPEQLSFASNGETATILTVWHDTRVGHYTFEASLSRQGFEQLLSLLSDAAHKDPSLPLLLPYRVSAYGPSDNPRYAVLFEASDVPLKRKLTVTAPPGGGGDIYGDPGIIGGPGKFQVQEKPPSLPGVVLEVSRAQVTTKAFDDYVAKLMKHYNIRGAQLAITRGTHLVFSRAYTWAESDYPTITPLHQFRVGSVSKLYAYLAALRVLPDQSIDGYFLDEIAPVAPILALNKKPISPAINPGLGQIKVRDLIRQRVPWPDEFELAIDRTDVANQVIPIQTLIDVKTANLDPEPVVNGLYNEYLAVEFAEAYHAKYKKKLWETDQRPVDMRLVAAVVATYAKPILGGLPDHRYANINSALLAHLVTQRSPWSTYSDVLNEEIIRWLGISKGAEQFVHGRFQLVNASKPLNNPAPFHAARPQLQGSDYDFTRIPAQENLNVPDTRGAEGGVAAPASDVARLIAALHSGYFGFYGEIIYPTRVAAMWTPSGPVTTPGGWFWWKGPFPYAQQSGTVFHHNGLYEGFAALAMYRLLDKDIEATATGIVLAINQNCLPGPDQLGRDHGGNLSLANPGRDLYDIADRIAVWPTVDYFGSLGYNSLPH